MITQSYINKVRLKRSKVGRGIKVQELFIFIKAAIRHFFTLTQEIQSFLTFGEIHSNKQVRQNKFILIQSYICIVNST